MGLFCSYKIQTIQLKSTFFICRLIDHLEKSGNINEEIPFRTLFETYKFENIEEREIHGDVNIETFSKYIRKLFPEAGFHRKRLPNGQKMRMIRGLHLRQNVPNTEESNVITVIQKALDHFSEEVDISGQTAHQIICCMRTKFKINGMEIHKIIKFNVDKSWELWIAGKEVNLQQAKISKYFQFTTNSVLGVLHIVSMMELCEGIQITKSIVCSRFHTIEDFENTCDKENTGRRRIRSMICQKLTSLIGTSKACVTCQRMIFDTSGKSQGEILKEKDKNEQRQQKNNSTTEEDLRQMIPNAPPEMITFLSSQTNNISRNPKGRRWPKEVISVFLQLYNRSPLGYEALRQSNLLVLPSPSLLLLYKNCVKQKVGFMDEIFEWMLNEAIRLQIPKEGYFGGIILDEMAVQEDLQIERNSKGIELVGLVDKGEEGNLCSTLRQGQKIRKLGNHILQLVFLGFTGFRFPIAHFVSDQIQAYDMYSLFWEATDKLQMFGFTCVYTSMDGAQCNRTFLNMHVSTMQTTIVQNPCNYEECVVFMMDYSHVIKKLRNNILKSGIKKGCTRNVTLVTGENIQWQMFCDAYHWDKQNALQIHRRLTNEHLYPSTQSKMRNHLAEQVMDTDMLHLLKSTRVHLIMVVTK
ncbi:hypothetical protein FSP39_015012 [Pinctada imbricata]|uniref:Transposable element P transposase-like RNase H domain-containing protein n=1 Tax=Pinctada imbricata TaxID=66713 RepID=A0AA88YSD9_PINIB|nr:hypothetical protein FSP39_015012 [Pinctada imbricata]